MQKALGGRRARREEEVMRWVIYEGGWVWWADLRGGPGFGQGMVQTDDVTNEQDLKEHFKENPLGHLYDKLSTLVMGYLMVYNKKRSGELGKVIFIIELFSLEIAYECT